MKVELNSQNPESAAESPQVFGLAEVESMVAQGYNLIPLVEKLDQAETSGALYEKLRGDGPSFLMESAETDERLGRYSFIGIEPQAVIRLESEGMMVNGEAHEFSDPYEFVDGLVTRNIVAPVADLPPYFGGAAGLFGYDLARYREPSIGEAKPDQLDLPEMALIVPGVTVAIDHHDQAVSIIKNLVVESGADRQSIAEAYDEATAAIADMKRKILEPSSTNQAPSASLELDFISNMTQEEFEAAVETAKRHTESGDAFQIVPSQRFSSDRPVDVGFARRAYGQLKRLNPSRYSFLFEFGDFSAAGCSPETLVRVSDGRVENMAIAGTRKRGVSAEEDRLLAADLLDDAKEIAEHSMLVDLARNDVGQVSQPGSVGVSREMEVENYSHVMHLTSEIDGLLAEGKSALDALASIAPAGTLSGAPKIRAMQIIDELEPDKRGFYGGAVGYVSPNGDLDSCIFIRSFIVDKDGHIHVQAGAGVVADSDPTSEYEETVMKAAAPLEAIRRAADPTSPGQRLLVTEQNPVPKKCINAQETGPRVLLIDNFDSFTHNLAGFLAMSGADVEILRNDVSVAELKAVNPDLLVVSPGPGTPERDSGNSIEALRFFSEKGVPSLGVCLGHQAMARAFGADVVQYEPIHGKQSQAQHDGRTIFTGLPNPLQVMRYHSLIANNLSPNVERSAYLVDGNGREIVMGLRHEDMPAEGVQFHPESFYTESGLQLISNFVRYNELKDE